MAYNPGNSVRVDSLAAAAYVKRCFGKPVIFNLSTRDKNTLALQTHMLGAQVWDVPNVLVVHDDGFSEKDRSRVQLVFEFKPGELVASIVGMNAGLIFLG